ncbi:TPA: hypothetical protein ACHVH6_000608 [Streptococcus suis]
MNTYKNERTGAEITTECELKGDWKLVSASGKEGKKKTASASE